MYTSAGVSRIVKFRVVEVGLEKDELVEVDGIQGVRDKRDLIYTMRKP
jgi:hypothetical protein